MLILSRNIGEVVRVGDNIEVTVVAVNGHQVRLGINAPREVVVDREEIANRKQHERATSLRAENGAITTALEVTARSDRPHIRVTKRRISTAGVQSSALSPGLPPTPERGSKPTLHIGPSKSKITSTYALLPSIHPLPADLAALSPTCLTASRIFTLPRTR
jgi:carbon storage regulator